METGKPGLVSAPVHSSSVAAPAAKKMDIQTPLTAVYIHAVPALPPQPYPQAQPPAAPREPATLHLAMPPLYSKETLPFLTLHIAGGLQSQQLGLSLAAAAPVARPKSAGKHVCPHCGRDCMKPSVLEKHLRCHTGERPYPCTTCGISFKTQSNLYKHKRTQAHARLSSESEQSSLGSQDSLHSSRETCTSSLSLDGHSEESGSLEKDVTAPSAELTCPASTAKVHSVQKQGPDADWAPIRDSVNEQSELTSVVYKTKPNESAEIAKGEEKKRADNEKPALTPNRHLTLQRQEATLFSKQWESSVSRGKTQSHESTDSGFSESSDQYPSPGSVLPDHSMDSLTESTAEHLEQRSSSSSHRHSEPGQSGQEPKDNVSEQAQRTLEEHISKLISENTAVVEDKRLENVRPRKTVLSKQGSIDLPMPYTYKDSFHFDMRINKAPNVGLHRNRRPGLYSSVPTQQSITVEHAPLTRSSSLPFSVTLLQPERSSPTSSFQGDYVTLVRRGSSGQINPTGFAIKSVDQQVSAHRPLVRQTAVDCNHATDGLFMNSSVEEACTSSLSCDGDSNDICGEPSNRKFRRKKAQKFAYNKWYMYGGGTFKKLYSAEKGCDNSVVKARKASTNPGHEVVQGIQKRFLPVHKEIVTMTGSTIKSTSSSATVVTCCLPANLPTVSGVDPNQKASQLHSSCTSLKTPLLRNLSLSTLQLSSISSTGSSVTHSTDSTSRAETERLMNKEKYTESVPQLCEEQIPSDRKKQKTDDKIIFSLGIETNTLTQASPSVTGSVPKQDTNQTNQKLNQLKGPLFPPCITNAKGMSVSASPAISILSTAKTNFLPKYQLKLPNASTPSPQTLNQPTGIDDHNFTSGPSTSHADQTSPIVTTSTASEKKYTDPLTPLLAHGHNIKKSNSFSSAQGHLVFPLLATTPYQSETPVTRLNQNLTPNLTAHRQFTTIPTTTTAVHEHHARLCTTLIQSSPSKKTVVGSVTTQLPRPNASVMQNIPATPIVTTEKIQPFVAAFAAFSQDQHPPLSHTHPSPTSHQLDPINRVTAGPKMPIVPCHIASFDSAQPAAQNVFHVHTADLQICLQIISDEQLALIEPQIEREVNTEGTSLLQRNYLETMDLDVIQKKVQSSVSMESTTEGKNHEKPRNQKEMDPREPSPLHNMESTTKHQHQKAQPNTLTTTSAESMPSESSHLLHSYVNTVPETMRTTGHAMSTVALLKAVQSGRSQTSEEEHVLTLSPSAEEHVADRNVSKGGLVSETLPGQHELCLAGMTSLPPSTTAQNNTGSGLLHQRSQHKCINQRTTCSAGEIKSECKASVYESTNLEYGEPPPPLQAGLGQASSVECCDALPNTVFSFPINNCTVPGDGNPQPPVDSSDLVDSRLANSEIQQSSKLADMGCDAFGPLDHSAPSQDMMLSESQDIITSSYSETHLGQFTSVPCSIQVERLKDVTAVLSTVAELIEGGSLAGCAVQKEPETLGHGGTPGQPDSTDWGPEQSQEAGQTHHQCTERQDSGGMEEENGGMRSIKTEEVLGQWGKSESHCRYIHLPDKIKPEEEERKAKTNSYKNSWLSEQHHQHLSQAHLGMSEYPPQTPLQGPSTSNNLNSPANSHTSLFTSPQPEVEMNSFYFSQQWELSVTHNQQTEFLSETSLTKHINQQSHLIQTQNAFSQIETNNKQTQQPIPNETFARQDQKTQDQGHTSISLPAEALPLRETGTAVNSSTSSSTHPSQLFHSVHISGATGGMTGDAQSTNNGLLDNTVRPSNLWTAAYPEHDDEPESEVRGTHDHTTQSSNPVRADMTNKYQSLFSAGHLHGYQTPDCLTSGARPVPSCQVYPDDTSSSDDEGKLIIEL